MTMNIAPTTTKRLFRRLPLDVTHRFSQRFAQPFDTKAEAERNPYKTNVPSFLGLVSASAGHRLD